MLYVYIFNTLIYLDTSSVSVRFGYFEYRNIRTVRIFEGFGLIPVSGISIWFRYGSSVLVFLPKRS